MTEQQLTELEFRLEQATPGPWSVDATSEDPQEVYLTTCSPDPRLGYEKWEGFVVCYGSDDQPEHGRSVAIANAEFIAHARSDTAQLIDTIRQLRRELDFYKQNDGTRLGIARQAGAEAMRVAIQSRLRTHWDKGVANIAATVPVPEFL